MAKDPYKYFRVEAAELLDNLTHGVQELDKGLPDPGMVASLLRLAHTLKGASQVVKQPVIAQVAHTVEDMLGPYRESKSPVPRNQTAALMKLLDQIGEYLARLDSEPPAAPPSAEPPRLGDSAETVRVEVEEMDELLRSLSEASVDLAAIEAAHEELRRAGQLAAWIGQQAQARPEADHGRPGKLRGISDELLTILASSERHIAAGVERAGREIRQARERADRLRLLPAQTVFPPLARAAREAASALGKQVHFEGSGGEVRLDAQVLTVVRDALLHLVRNAVAHGIESREERARDGKPGVGHIAIEVRRAGNRVSFFCRDDGRGMDLAAIRKAAVQKGVISETAAGSLGLKEAIDLILRGGVSTSAVTRISGRGIGLDVVRDAAARLKGDIRIQTAARQGTTVEFCVPVSQTSLAALLVESGGLAAAIPLDAVRGTVRLAAGEIVSSGNGESIVYDGAALRFARLAELLDRPGEVAARTAVLVSSDAKTAAVGVQKVTGTGTILVRVPPPLAAGEPIIAGAALDAGGNPLLVLDPEVLVAAAQGERMRAERNAGRPRAPILIIDDSLTTRMVEQSVLESAGHRVECAVSAEEALEKAHQRKYGLFLVDVEMPGMDGYQFIARAHDDPQLRDTPSILVTSRNSPADRRRGEEVGARAFVVKSEFDQGRFLEMIRQLVEA